MTNTDSKVIRLKVGNVYVLAYLFLLFAGFALLRSVGLTESTSDNLLDDAEQMILGGLFVLLIGMPTVWIAASPSRAAYFLGASPALGMFPSLPHLPFLREVTHFMVFIAILAHWRARKKASGRALHMDGRLLAYFAFLAVAAASSVINFVIYGSLWQLKVSASSFLIYVAFGTYWLLLQQCELGAEREELSEMLKGFVHSAIFAAGIGLIAIVLLFATPYSGGINQMGNDTILGLGYFDRMQLLFGGPTFAGMFFVFAMSFTIYLSQSDMRLPRWLTIIFLQIAPWLIMASGSRAARICFIGMLIICLLYRPFRRISLLMLSSSLIALAIGMDFQSLPNAIKYFLGEVIQFLPNAVKDAPGEVIQSLPNAIKSFLGEIIQFLPKEVKDAPGEVIQSLPKEVKDAPGEVIQSLPNEVRYYGGNKVPDISSPEEFRSLSLSGRFFEPGERSELVRNAVDFFANSSTFGQAVGHGLGVAGFRTGLFPSPHQQPLNILIETGIVGLMAYYGFLYYCFIKAFRLKIHANESMQSFILIIVGSFGCLMILSLAYETSLRGTTLVLLTLLFLAPIQTQMSRPNGS